MSALGAFNASTLGAYNSSVLGARGPGGEAPAPPGILFSVMYEGVRDAVIGFPPGEERIYQIVGEFVPAYQPHSIYTGLSFSLRDFVRTDFNAGIYETDFIPYTASTAALLSFYEDQGYVFTEYTEADYYALAPWTRGPSTGFTRRELPIRPVQKVWLSYEIASYNNIEEPATIFTTRRPNDVNSDLETSLRRTEIGLVGSPEVAQPPSGGLPTIYLDHEFSPGNRDNGRRSIHSRFITTPYAPTIEAGSGTIEIQGGPAAFPVSGTFRAKCALFTSDPSFEPVAVVAQQFGTAIPNDAYFDLFNMLEVDTRTVTDPGYIDVGLVAGTDGGFAFRWDPALFGDLAGLDIYMTDTPKNADAKLGNSPNFLADSWKTLYNLF